MRRITTYGGLAASLILIAFGIGALVMGLDGRGTVRDNLKREQIVGAPDMSPSAIRAELAKAGLKNIDVPSSSVAGATVATPYEARTFAESMSLHTVRPTGGQVYAEMGRYRDKPASPPPTRPGRPSTRRPRSPS